jgi:hypothetical protein
MEAEEFFDKVMNLKDGEKLTTSFGQATFEAYKEDSSVVIRQVKYGMYNSNEILTAKTPESLSNQIKNREMCQHWYATNAFTGRIEFLDNLTNFLKAFK